MRLDQDLLEILCCPATSKPLIVPTAEQQHSFNQAIQAGRARRADGTAVIEPIRDVLVTPDLARIYPVEDGVPVLLLDQAVLLSVPDIPTG